METIVTITRTPGGYVPSMGGIGGTVWQQEIAVIHTHTGARIIITDGRTEIATSHGRTNVSDDVPAEILRDHTAITNYWYREAERWAAEAAHLTFAVIAAAA